MAINLAYDVALEAAHYLAPCFAFCGSSGYIGFGFFVVSHTDDGDPVERGISLAVAASVQSHAVCLAACTTAALVMRIETEQMKESAMFEDATLTEEVLRALDERRQIPLLTSRPGGFSMTRAYGVSAQIAEARAQRGECHVGRKIGFTNRTIWDEFNVSAPIFAPMYQTTVRPLGAPFCTTDLMEPRIEPEIAFRLARAPNPGMTSDDLIACVSGICAGFEMVQSMFADWKFEAADTVAAFGLHGAFLHGPICEVSSTDRKDWVESLATFRTTIFRNGEVADKGHARNVLGGGPLVALRHLAELVARVPHALPLEEGEIITTGTLTQALPVKPGQTWQASFDGLPLDPISIELIYSEK
jgi:2-oxo-3-hexenedioate decarboxylase